MQLKAKYHSRQCKGDGTGSKDFLQGASKNTLRSQAFYGSQAFFKGSQKQEPVKRYRLPNTEFPGNTIIPGMRI
jgi:hypothetical protein